MKIDGLSAGLLDIIACPVSLTPLSLQSNNLVSPGGFVYPEGDFRTTWSPLPDKAWLEGQDHYVKHHDKWLYQEDSFFTDADRETEAVYEKFPLTGTVLDIGGGFGIAALQAGVDSDRFISVDPMVCRWSDLPDDCSFKKHYGSLANYVRIPSFAENLPIKNQVIDTVHLRSCLDHLMNPHRSLLEARRVLKPDGQIIIGLALEGAYKLDSSAFKNKVKGALKKSFIGEIYEHFFDKHIFHPTPESLKNLIEGAGLIIQDQYMQPGYHDVVYIKATL
jgi:ubiquinone/menaquinone biosynthesis C-methylase UbiE/uncharacterized protein YbaR (Trm112 family)